MQLVNSSGLVIDFNVDKSIYTGGTSEIYKVDESILLKVHKLLYDGVSMSQLDIKVFDLIKTIKHENFINLIERYQRIPKTQENVEAYTYEHILGDTYNLLFLRTDFMIDQFKKIANLFDIFSSEGILVSDVDIINSVVLKDKIVIIDPDLYQIEVNKDILLKINKLKFVNFITSFFDFYISDRKKITELFDGISKEEDPVMILNKRLNVYKYPIDYFSDKK